MKDDKQYKQKFFGKTKEVDADYIVISKDGVTGMFTGSGKIGISIHKTNGANRDSVCIAVPRVVMGAAGIKVGDRVIGHTKSGSAYLERTNDLNRGYSVVQSGGAKYNTGKLRVVLPMIDGVKECFFPNGEKRYGCSVFETRPNIIEFLIGEES